MQLSAFVISAPRSGSGKTTMSLGLMRALKDAGHSVHPFKCGPDYIDTQFHHVASGNESVNLDTFMASESHVRELFRRYSRDGGVSVIEGAMGMFDGYSGMKGSCAAIARLLDLPVVLLVDATATAYSVAATIYGFKHFKEDIRIAGVVFNRVASPSHFSFLRDACSDAGVECFGYIARDNSLQTPSRHLGLSLTAIGEMDAFIEAAAESVKATVDIDRLLAATRVDIGNEIPTIHEMHPASTPILKIAVAHDEAFNFIYPANIRALKSHPRYEVSLSWFSPLSDREMPEADILYLPGGYPELYSRRLSDNTSMRRSIHDYTEAGGRILAECGGMIYLGREIDGEEMCGVLPLKVTMENARLTLGYRTIDLGAIKLRGHEFHYSRVTGDDNHIGSIANQYNAKGQPVDTPLYRFKNCIAGYTHLYWAETDLLKIWDL